MTYTDPALGTMNLTIPFLSFCFVAVIPLCAVYISLILQRRHVGASQCPAQCGTTTWGYNVERPERGREKGLVKRSLVQIFLPSMSILAYTKRRALLTALLFPSEN